MARDAYETALKCLKRLTCLEENKAQPTNYLTFQTFLAPLWFIYRYFFIFKHFGDFIVSFHGPTIPNGAKHAALSAEECRV